METVTYVVIFMIYSDYAYYFPCWATVFWDNSWDPHAIFLDVMKMEWTQCIIWQQTTPESLWCPLNVRGVDTSAPAAYALFLENVAHFRDLNSLQRCRYISGVISLWMTSSGIVHSGTNHVIHSSMQTDGKEQERGRGMLPLKVAMKTIATHSVKNTPPCV